MQDRFGQPQLGPLYTGLNFTGHGRMPTRPGEDREGGSPFGRLSMAGALGKATILVYDNRRMVVQPAATQLIGIEGDDADAQQMVVTLVAPRVVVLDFTDIGIDQQNQQGSQDNSQVSLTHNFPGTASPISWPPLEAVLEWGTGGCSARAIVDYVNGTTISVVASYLRVFGVVTQSAASGNIQGTRAAYQLEAFVGPGFSRTGTAQKTVYVDTIDDSAESDVYEIPKFARKAYVVGCDTATPPAVTAGYLRLWQNPQGNAGTSNVGNFFANGNQPISFDIPNAAQYFSVYNQSGVAMKMSVIFELGIS